MANPVISPYPMFFDTDGKPLTTGRVYVGVAGLNPLTNPQTAYWDVALTIPAIDINIIAGYIVYNGAPGKLYVPVDYSILITDKNGSVVFSRLTCPADTADLFMTTTRSSMLRATRIPASFDFNAIVDTGYYSWINGGTVNYPTGCAAGDSFVLEVLAGPDGSGLITQRVIDITVGPTSRAFIAIRSSSNAGASWSVWLLAQGLRSCLSTSGALGALTVANDFEYFLTATSSATLPANGTATQGQRLTFKTKTNATSTISAAAGQTIGTTSSTSFVLYAQEDYVTLEYDGTSVWYVIATNGPVKTVTAASSSVFGFGSGSGNHDLTAFTDLQVALLPGVYEIYADLMVSGTNAVGNQTVYSLGASGGATGLVLGSVYTRGLGDAYMYLSVKATKLVVTSAVTLVPFVFCGVSGGVVASLVSSGTLTAKRIA